MVIGHAYTKQTYIPAQSPDLNPIENLCLILHGRFKRRKHKNEDVLFNAFAEVWYELPTDLVNVRQQILSKEEVLNVEFHKIIHY